MLHHGKIKVAKGCFMLEVFAYEKENNNSFAYNINNRCCCNHFGYEWK